MIKRGDKMETNKLKGLRAEYNIKQKELAKKIGITATAYSLKETGEQQFKESEINIILDLFNEKYENVFLDRKYTQTKQKGE